MFLITYDLNKPGQNYQKLIEAIQSLGNWCHYLDSTWLVKTHLTVEQVSNRLRMQIDDNDKLLVTKIHPYSTQGWLPQDAWNWIQS